MEQSRRPGEKASRRDTIASAGIRVIAQRGVRALTHRAVDAEAALPLGSTSYYAPTRRALIEEIVRLLADRSLADLEVAARAFAAPEGRPAGPAEEWLVDALDAAVDALARRPEDLKVRCALLLELDRDDPARAVLAERSPVQEQLRCGLADALAACGVPAASDRADEVMALCDALLMRSAITGAHASVGSTLSAYVHGLLEATHRGAQLGARA